MILGVAIEYDGVVHTLPAPNRHHHVIREIAKMNGVGIRGPDRQGFYTATDKFLTRPQALAVALACGQVANPKNIRSGELFSEDLW